MEKSEKAAERRAKRKQQLAAMAKEVLSLDCKLSEETLALLQRLANPQEHPAAVKIEVKVGDKLGELFMKYPNLSYKKLQQKCKKAGWVINSKGVVEEEVK